MSSKSDLEGHRRRSAAWRVIAEDAIRAGRRARRVVARSRSPILLAFIKHARICNTVWITADMHYTAANYYDPNRAVFQDFEPFWIHLRPAAWPAPGRHRSSTTLRAGAVYEKGCSKSRARTSRLLRPAVLRACHQSTGLDGGDDGHPEGTSTIADLWSTRIEPKPELWSGRIPTIGG